MSRSAKVQRVHVSDSAVSRMQGNLANAIDQLSSAEILDGYFVAGIRLFAGRANSFDHGLGRDLRGYIVVRRSGNCVVWDDDTASSSKTLALYTSADCTVALWIF